MHGCGSKGRSAVCAGFQVLKAAGLVVEEVAALHTLLIRFQGWGEDGPWTGRLVAVDVNVRARLGLVNHDHVIGVDWLSNGLVVGREAEGIIVTFAPFGRVLEAVVVVWDSRTVAKETGVTWALDPLVGAELDEADVVPHSQHALAVPPVHLEDSVVALPPLRVAEVVLAAVEVVAAARMTLEPVDGAGNRLKCYIVTIEDDIWWLSHRIESSDVRIIHRLACNVMASGYLWRALCEHIGDI